MDGGRLLAARPAAVTEPLEAEYVLPLAWDEDSGLEELRAYLGRLASWIDVTVVDGSPPDRFAAHRRTLPEAVRHLPPQPWPGPNGKVAGVMTGVRAARHDRVVLADDDVRYDRAALETVVEALDSAELVRPQNVFDPQPWHARWDTARSLLNRAFGSDYPGTLGVRRSALLGAGGYDGHALFENLELIRTLRAAGGRETRLDGLAVQRLPPTLDRFLGQRVRQAYDDLAQPVRLAAELALLPAALVAARRPRRLLAAAALAIVVAEVGRRRNGGRRLFPPTAALWAPAWLTERAVCVWLALLALARGGVRYRDRRVRLAAHSQRALASRRNAHA
ncbi:MAG: hypothetical protein QOE37_213 [Microbacteriaceae bacterium]|nr:hypothetical protein [Microbacteriaceae bacterium]